MEYINDPKFYATQVRQIIDTAESNGVTVKAMEIGHQNVLVFTVEGKTATCVVNEINWGN